MPVPIPSRKGLRHPDDFSGSLPDWARELCLELRRVILSASPDLRETVRWGTLCFECGGLVCGLAAYRRHAAVSFFRGAEMPDPDGLFNGGLENIQTRTVRFTPSSRDFDPAALRRLVEIAVGLNLSGEKAKPPRRVRPPVEIPDELTRLLANSPRAARHFEALPESGKREFAHWISSAKRPETREARLKRALLLLKAGRRPYDGKEPLE